MAAFLVDEDLPLSTAIALREAGYAAQHVREVGLRGKSDADVFAFAQQGGASLVTADKGFANILSFPLGSHLGVIVLRVPNQLPPSLRNRELLRALADLGDTVLTGLLVIVEAGRTRVRHPHVGGI